MSKNIKPENFGFALSNKAIFKTLLWVIAFLIATHLVLQFFFHVLGIEINSTLRGRFDVDNEISIPTWFSQLLLFIPAVLGLLIYKIEKSRKNNASFYWLLFSALFLFLSIDEGAMLHEAFITKFREWTTDGTAAGFANHLWLIPVGVVFLVLLVPFIKFIRTLPHRTAFLLALGIGTFGFGAIVYETFGLIVFSPIGGFAYEGFNVAVEEGLEMLGASIVIYGVLEHLRLASKNTTLTLKK